MQQRSLTEEVSILSKWYVEEGGVIKEGQYLYALETGKATFDVEAEASGTILKILASEGDEVPVKKIICVIGNPGEAFVLPGEEGSKEEFSQRHKGTEKEGASGKPVGAPIPAAAALPVVAASPVAAVPLAASGEAVQGKTGISPRARRLALARGLNYSGISGTGPGGRILEEDVKAALAAAVHSSAQSVAQFTIYAHCDASELLSYRERWNTVKGPEILTINDLVAFAVSRLLPRFPYLNAHFCENETLTFSHVNLGISVETPQGLLVPTVKNADTKSLVGLSREIKTLADRCHGGGATPLDLADGTFTLSNMDAWGVDFFTPILNPPQTGILGVGTIEYRRKKGPLGMTDYPALALSLTVERRAVAGASAAAFLKALCENLENFCLLFLM